MYKIINKNVSDVNKIEAALKTDITLGYSFEDGGMLNKRGTPTGGVNNSYKCKWKNF